MSLYATLLRAQAARVPDPVQEVVAHILDCVSHGSRTVAAYLIEDAGVRPFRRDGVGRALALAVAQAIPGTTQLTVDGPEGPVEVTAEKVSGDLTGVEQSRLWAARAVMVTVAERGSGFDRWWRKTAWVDGPQQVEYVWQLARLAAPILEAAATPPNGR